MRTCETLKWVLCVFSSAITIMTSVVAMNCFSCPEGSSWEICNRTSRPVQCSYVVNPRCVKVSIKRSWEENTTTESLVTKTRETFMKTGCITHSQCETLDFEPCIQDNTSHITVSCSRWCCFGNLCNQAAGLDHESKYFLTVIVVCFVVILATKL